MKDDGLAVRGADQSPAEALFEEFEQDHRCLTQGLDRVLRLARAGYIEALVEQAERLDREAGPHIEFEEEVFYPNLRETLGDSFVDQLFDEHDAGKKALLQIRELAAAAPRDSTADRVSRAHDWQDGLKSVVSNLQVALEHALSCGTLLSHLEALDDETLERMTGTLEQLRKAGRRWTSRPDGVAGSSAQASDLVGRKARVQSEP